MKREYPDAPIPAVSGVIFDENGHVLLIRRAHAPAKGKWSLPGGVVQLGESLCDALKREVREECGLEVEPGPILLVSERIICDESARVQYHYVLLDYLCTRIGGSARKGSDASDVQWITLEDLASVDLTAGVMDVIRKGANLRFD